MFEAFDTALNRRVALKTLRSKDARSIVQFQEEFFTLKDLEHPNLIRFYELFREEHGCFFTMELVEGVDFLTYIRDLRRIFDETRLRNCLSQLVSAVFQLHCEGIIHRDIKPTNMVVTGEGRLVLLDFGLAAQVIAGRQVDGIGAVGTKDYMSPEQAFGLPVGASADWYSVGVVLYQSLTRRLPERAAIAKENTEDNWWDVKPPIYFNTELPRDLNDLCVGMLAISPEDRLSGREIVDRLGLAETSTLRRNKPGAEWTMTNFDYVGRAEELLLLKQAYEEVGAGKTKSVLIVGEAGIGKTALAKEFIRRLEGEQRSLTLAGRFSMGASIRFKAFRNIVDELKRVLRNFERAQNTQGADEQRLGDSSLLSVEAATAVTQIFPNLMDVEAIAQKVDPQLKILNPQELRAKAYGALRTLLFRLAADYRVVLFLDDIHWADRDSLSLLADIMKPSESPPLLLITTIRSEYATHLDLTNLLPGVRELPLAGLSLAEAKELTRSISKFYGMEEDGLGVNESTLGEARGHPLFLAELVQYKVAVGENLGVGGLEDAIWSRISKLREPARKMLEIICVSSVPLDEEIVAEIAGLDRGQWVPALAQLLVGCFVQSTGRLGAERIEPYHHRIRETMIAHIDAEDLKKYHLSLAYELGQSAELFDKEIVVKHFEGAGKFQEAADLARRTALIASDQLAFGKAAELLATALRLGEYADRERRKVQMDLGDALCNAGLGEEAYDIYLEASEEADAATRLDCNRRAIEQLMLTGHFIEGYRQIDNLLAETGASLPTTPKRALFSLLKNRALLSLRGTRWKRKEENQIPPNKIAQLDIYAVVAGGLALMDTLRGADFQVRSLILALGLGEEKRLANALAMEAIFLASQGTESAGRAKKLLAEAVEIAEATGDPFLYWGSLAAKASVKYFEARFPDAAMALGRAEQGLRTLSNVPRHTINSIQILRASSLRMLLRLRELREVFDEYVWDSMRRGDIFMQTSIRLQCSRIHLAADQVEEARKNLASSMWIPPAGGYHLNNWYQMVTIIELSLYLGNATGQLEEFNSMFHELYRSMSLRVATLKLEAYWLRGRLLLTALADRLADRRADERESGSALGQVEAIVRKIRRKLRQLPPSAAWSALLNAAVAYYRGDQNRAIKQLRCGIEAASLCEQHVVAEAAKRRLGELIGGEEGSRLLQESETGMKEHGIVDPERFAGVFVPKLAPTPLRTR